MIWKRHTVVEIDGVERCGIDAILTLGERAIHAEFAVTEFDDEAKTLKIIATDLESMPPFIVVSSPDIVLTFEESSA